MKRMRIILAAFSIVGLLLVSGTFAQQRQDLPGSRPGAPEATKPEEPPVPKASAFIGSSVINPQGESLGQINDLVLDPAEGRIKYAALAYGSVLGFGGKLFAVPWDALKLAPDGETFVLDVSKETLETSSGFEKSAWPWEPDPTLQTAAAGRPQSSEQTAAMGSGERSESAMVSGTVAEVNAENESFTLQAEDGKAIELQAPAEALIGLQTGDSVEVKLAGERAMEIHKKESTRQPGMGQSEQTQPRQPERQN